MENNLTFSVFLLSKNLDEKYINQINKVRSILMERNSFKYLSFEDQFLFCFDCCLIALQTSRHDLSKLYKKEVNENDFRYSIYSKP